MSYLYTSSSNGAAIGSDLEHLNRGLLTGRSLLLAFAFMNDKLLLEMRQKLEVLLLLMCTNNLQLVSKQRLKLLLKATTNSQQSVYINV